MKKIILTSILAAAAMNINAQLVVDSLGRVGIATETPKSLLSVGGNGNHQTSVFCKSTNKLRCVHIENTTDSDNDSYGGYFSANNTLGNSCGIYSIALGSEDMEYPQRAIGINGIAGHARTGVGVFGGRYLETSVPVNFAGVYGAGMLYTPSFYNYPGIYAGFFNGIVRVTDGLYATLLTPAASAAPSEQSGTAALSDRGENVSDKLSQVQAVQFLRQGLKPTEEEADQEKEEGIKAESQLSPVQYGLDAAQLKAVYPELVYEDANGNVSINYVEMVPLLVQSINELKAELAELKGTSARKAKAETTGIEDNVSDVDMVRMDQNKPNPFSESTVITLNIPSETQSATIFIYDMSGKQVQSIPVSERGETNITVYARDLSAGMYIYTLVVDGKVTVTRRMIVTLN